MKVIYYPNNPLIRIVVPVFSALFILVGTLASLTIFGKSELGVKILFTLIFFPIVYILLALILSYYTHLKITDDEIIYKGLDGRKKFPLTILEIRAKWSDISNIYWVESEGHGNIFVVTQKGNFEYGYLTNKKHNDEVMKKLLSKAPHLSLPAVISKTKLRELYLNR